MSDQFTPSPDQVAPSSDITSDDKLWALLAYIFTPIVPIIILLMDDKKNRPFLKAHNAQALAAGLVLYVASGLLTFVFIGFCTGPLSFILFVYYGLKAYKGEYVEIPVITKFVKDQGWA